jgi:hypothetical protein
MTTLVRLIDAWLLMSIIDKDRERLGEHHDSVHDRSIHNGEYMHFLKRIVEMPEAYNVEDRINSVVKELLSLKEELPETCERTVSNLIMIDRIKTKNETIDKVVEIVKKGFEL